MANPQRGEMDLVVGDKTYTLALDLNAMCELEDVLSSPTRQVTFVDVTRGLNQSNMRYIRAFFWACLRRHHKEVGLLEVADIIADAGGFDGFMQAVNGLLEFTQPDATDRGQLKDSTGRPTPARAAAAGIGARSTSKPAKSA